jgi:DNA-directed RNA polymerase subunit L
MELKIIEKAKKKLIIDVIGEDHTFCNALKEELWNDKHVQVASYSIDHPLERKPHIVVETDGEETPEEALIAAAKRVGKEAAKFKELAQKLK